MDKVIVSPTWSEAWHYANLSGQTTFTALGVIGILAAAIVVYKLGEKSIGWMILAAAILALSVASILSKPISVHINNDKEVSKDYLEKVGHQYIIDSCYTHNQLVDAAFK
jgi:enhancing lycopene biosynthesis protein 2